MLRITALFVLTLLLLTGISLAQAGNLYLDTSNADEITISSDVMDGLHIVEIRLENVSLDENANTIQNKVDSQQMVNLPFHQEVLEAANSTALAPALIHAVITVESKHNPKAVSKKGAYGLMQLMPATAKRYGLNGLKKANHRQHILAGARYLKELIILFDGNLELALAAYNAGPSAVKKYQHKVPPFRETKLYVPKVLKFYRNYSS